MKINIFFMIKKYMLMASRIKETTVANFLVNSILLLINVINVSVTIPRMCSDIGSNLLPAYFADPEWLDALLKEHEEEAKEEARWPILLLQASGRKLIWHLCALLRVSNQGIPGNACRLMERYLSRHIQAYFQVYRNSDEWNRFRASLASRYYLVAVSSIQLAAKMTDLTVPLSATLIRTTLLREGVVHSNDEIVNMEFHVYQTLDFRIPIWTSLEAAEFLASHIGFGSISMIKAVGLVINLTEYHRDLLELHMRCWSEVFSTPGSSSFNGRYSLGTLHMAAGCVSAAARYLRAPIDPTHTLANLTRTTPYCIRAISDIILNHILPNKEPPLSPIGTRFFSGSTKVTSWAALLKLTLERLYCGHIMDRSTDDDS